MPTYTKTISLTLKTGERVTGKPNYVDTQIVEFLMPDGSYRTIGRDEIAGVPSISKVTDDLSGVAA